MTRGRVSGGAAKGARRRSAVPNHRTTSGAARRETGSPQGLRATTRGYQRPSRPPFCSPRATAEG